MKLGWMTSAAVALGLSTFAPLQAKADDRVGPHEFNRGGQEVRVDLGRYDHDHDYGHDYDRGRDRDRRDYERDRERDHDHPVSVRDLPRPVLNTARDVGNGRYVESARHVSQGGRTYYVLEMDRRNKEEIRIVVRPDGDLIRIER